MKKSLLHLLMLVCSVNLFTSCGDDDDNVKYPIDTDIAGIYKGTLDISLAGTPIGSDIPKNITISKAGDTSVNMELKDFSFMGMDLGTITLSDCALTKDGDNYRFTGNQALNVEKYLLTGDIDAEGTISGNSVVVNLDIAARLSGLEQSVKVTYRGNKLSGSESSEAKITSFTFDLENEVNAIVIGQPQLDEATNTFTFRVDEAGATSEALKALVPTITVSDKATYYVEGGKADFSSNVIYTVIAENGTMATYMVKTPIKNLVTKYSFESWSDVKGGKNPYYDPLPTDELATPNQGVALLYSVSGYKGEYPVLQEEQGVEGKAVKLVTRYTKKQGGFINSPTITAGSLFTGEMVISISSMTKPLEATHFGIPYSKKPLFFKGYYKYTPGEVFREGAKDGSVDKVVEDKVDECSIVAVLYEVENDDEYLDGTNINESSKRVAIAQLEDGTAKSEFTLFNLEFTFLPGKVYDATAKYKIAIICSASKEGDNFKGAPGSTLILDELELIGE